MHIQQKIFLILLLLSLVSAGSQAASLSDKSRAPNPAGFLTGPNAGTPRVIALQ